MFNAFMAKKHKFQAKKGGAKKSGLRPSSAVVASEQNASHQFYKKGKKHKKVANDQDADDKKKFIKRGAFKGKTKKHKMKKKVASSTPQGMDSLSNYVKAPKPGKFPSNRIKSVNTPKSSVGPLQMGPAQPWRTANGSILKKSSKKRK